MLHHTLRLMSHGFPIVSLVNVTRYTRYIPIFKKSVYNFFKKKLGRNVCNVLHLQDFNMGNPCNVRCNVWCNMYNVSRYFFLFMMTVQVLFILLILHDVFAMS